MSEYPVLVARIADLEATITELRKTNIEQANRLMDAKTAFGTLLPRLGVDQRYEKKLRGLDPIEAVRQIAERGGTFRPSWEKDDPDQEPLTPEERAKITTKPRSYM